MNNYIVENKDLLKTIRNIRNQLLKETDKYFLIDFPIAYEQQLIIKAYRQELRNFINNNEIKILAGEKVAFPQQPYSNVFTDDNLVFNTWLPTS